MSAEVERGYCADFLIKSYEKDGRKHVVQWWDVPGVERSDMGMVTRLCAGAAGGVLVFDRDSPKSFEALGAWLQAAKQGAVGGRPRGRLHRRGAGLCAAARHGVLRDVGPLDGALPSGVLRRAVKGGGEHPGAARAQPHVAAGDRCRGLACGRCPCAGGAVQAAAARLVPTRELYKAAFFCQWHCCSLFSVTLRGGRRRGGRRGTGADGRSRLALEARERRGNVGRLHGAAGSAAHPAPAGLPPLVVHRQGCRGPRLRRHDRVPGQRYPHGTWLSEAVVARLPCEPCHA